MFITLTHKTGRALINIEHIIGIVEHEGRVYLNCRGENTEPLEVFETYDDVVARIELGRGKVW
jgi:hypothetical protein